MKKKILKCILDIFNNNFPCDRLFFQFSLKYLITYIYTYAVNRVENEKKEEKYSKIFLKNIQSRYNIILS